MTSLPVIDMTSLYDLNETQEHERVARAIESACRDTGFFYLTGHGVDPENISELECASRRFFALPEAEKNRIAMHHGGRAWRGYFPVGGELTSGEPDQKEGLYFGEELPLDHPSVLAGTPLHGPNLWPQALPELEVLVGRYMSSVGRAAQVLLRGVAMSLGLDAHYFATAYTAEPTVLFRIFHYPTSEPRGWGVGEHTDYGLLTLLAQDDRGGLEVDSPRGWIDAPPVPGTLVCNIGDMLDRLTGGFYRSTTHRVRASTGEGRLSFPLFFDPAFDARMLPLPMAARRNPNEPFRARWDDADLQRFEGTYGEYLIAKVSKVFPDLASALPSERE